jgi:hypothetical protein
MGGVQDAFAYVLFATVAVGGIAAIVGLLGTGKLYERIGKDGLYRDEASAGRAAPPAEAAGVREEEIRQLLSARNELRGHHGGELVDVELELAALLRPAVDPELEAEVRAFVISRNERRLARGQEPLNVDEEVARRLQGLSG